MDERVVRVRTEPPCEVRIGRGLLAECGPRLRELLGDCRVAVITESTVAPLYLDAVLASLEAAGLAPASYVFPAGEAHKDLGTLSDLLEFLARERLGRGDCVAALGGGVTGDLAGFAAGVYLRGVRCVQLPTTLLAAVDSAVGGKTAVDLAAGKNLAGVFHQPAGVLCDTSCLDTLPESVFAAGAAEAVKTAVLFDEKLFALLERGARSAEIDEVIRRCVVWKAAVVERDPTEQNERRLLNLGHTVGHAVEVCSGYAVSHGHAVAAGLAVMARAAERLGWAETGTAARICRCLEKNGLPTAAPYTPEALAEAAAGDKKRRGDQITVTLPRAIGRCELRTLALSELPALIDAGRPFS